MTWVGDTPFKLVGVDKIHLIVGYTNKQTKLGEDSLLCRKDFYQSVDGPFGPMH